MQLAAQRREEGDTNYEGTPTATPSAERQKESKESLLRRAIDKRLQRF